MHFLEELRSRAFEILSITDRVIWGESLREKNGFGLRLLEFTNFSCRSYFSFTGYWVTKLNVWIQSSTILFMILTDAAEMFHSFCEDGNQNLFDMNFLSWQYCLPNIFLYIGIEEFNFMQLFSSNSHHLQLRFFITITFQYLVDEI